MSNSCLIHFYYSYGCTWSMYYDGCKYSAGGGYKEIQKFKMKKSAPPSASQEIESSINGLATLLGMGSFW